MDSEAPTPTSSSFALPYAEPIAIVSAACRLPGHIQNPHQLWQFLQAGGIATSDVVPESRYNVAGHFDGSGRPGTLKTPGGMFIEDIDLGAFDAPFFHIGKSDAVSMDPQQRQLLEVVYECLENGGITMQGIDGDQIGCFVASYSADWHEMQSRHPASRAPGTTAGTSRAILSNRISHFFNIKGSSWTIDTACSGGLVGVDAACQYLRAGKLNGAIVAAAQLWMSPEYNEELGTMRAAASSTGRCHSFDAKADGYCRSEAVNAVYLKRLSDALRDGDPVRAVIRGTANNSDGRTPGLHSPNSDAQAAAIRAAYADAGIDSTQYTKTAFMECHATGTPAGDPSEVRGSASVLASMRPPSDPLIIGTIKSNLGHAEPGAGISGLMKAMMAVEKGIIPGNPTFITPNPNIDFAGLRVRASQRNMRWPQSTKDYRRASVASSGFGGSNAHVVLDNAEHYMQHHFLSVQPQFRTYVSSYAETGDVLSMLSGFGLGAANSSDKLAPLPNVLVFSAHDADSLKRQMGALSAHLVDPRVAIKLSDLSYTLSERRSRHFHRSFIVCRPNKGGNIETLPTDLAKYAMKPTSPVRIGFVFTGQGAQWSGMGADLIRLFPKTAKAVVDELDAALQELPADVRPSWSLLAELTEPRSSEHLREPEFSQPLVTALQLALLAVLKSWNVTADAVVGHSSGEIAAACSAGLLTPGQAILTAYFRGQAAKQVVMEGSMGMLAVGLGSAGVQKYLEDTSRAGKVVIACYNSPASVTLSGPTSLLSELAQVIQTDGHFARLLQVNLPYHSHYMSAIGDRYEKLLLDHGRLDEIQGETATRKIPMISSVSTIVLEGSKSCSAAYWKSNMVSAVQFDGACKRIVADQDLSANLLIEIGPSAALGGPIGQIIKQAGIDNVTYTSAAQRGTDSILALFGVAGQLFLHDCPVSLDHVNTDETALTEPKPAVIIDLPNYRWNHSTRYWHESLASKDWRFRNFPEHDLLGGKVLGTAWESPSWTKTLRLEDVPWLRDHKIGSEILFPASGYIAMAVEAARQATISTARSQNKAAPSAHAYHYVLRDVHFERGLVLEDETDTTLMLSLAPVARLGVKWWVFKVMSLASGGSSSSSDSWIEHSNGLVRLALNASEPLPRVTPDNYSLPLQYPTPARFWYKAFENAGYGYGPGFQKQSYIECTEGSFSARSTIMLNPPLSKWEPQPNYPLHPASMESCIQATLTSMYRGDRAGINNVLVPNAIDRIILSGDTWRSNEAVSVTTSESSSGITSKPLSNASLFDPTNGVLIIDLRGISMTSVGLQGNVCSFSTYTRVEWKPDICHLDSDTKIRRAILDLTDGTGDFVQEVLDLAAHKKPNMRVLEVDLTGGQPRSLWLSGNETSRITRAATSEFNYASDRPESVLSAQDLYSDMSSGYTSRFTLLPITSQSFVAPPELCRSDLVLIRTSQLPSMETASILTRNARCLLTEGGTIVLHVLDVSKYSKVGQESLREALSRGKFSKIRQAADGLFVAEATDADTAYSQGKSLVVLHFSTSPVFSWSSAVITSLIDKGWPITELTLEEGCRLTELPAKATILVMDEVNRPLFASMEEYQLEAIQSIVQRDCSLLWVTQGSQMHVSSPLKAICHGVFRSVRSMDPNARIVTLDVDSAAEDQLAKMADILHTVLLQVRVTPESLPADFEFVERGGLLYISRLRPAQVDNESRSDGDKDGLQPVPVDLHSTESTIGLVSGRPGILDTLHFAELGPGRLLVLGPEDIEVEIFAASVDDGDYALAKNLDPEDSTRLGYGGAGIVTRTGDSITDIRAGQRVALFHGGCVANRIVVARQVVFSVPDTMTFEDAATLPTAFVPAIYSIYHLAQLRQGQRVLIHSAANAVGIACVQLCQGLSCKPYVTVDSDEERKFLAEEVGVSSDHILLLNSENFAREMQDSAQNHGFDVIINTSQHHLPDQGWGVVSPGGVHVALGQTINDRSLLPMDYFTNNRSFCSLDIRTLPLDKLASPRACSQLSDLIYGSSIKHMLPKAVFPCHGVQAALQSCHDHNRLRNVVISTGPDKDVRILVKPEKQQPRCTFAPEQTYLLVGKLKGVSGSLALHLARCGAKYLVIMSPKNSENSENISRSIRAMGCSLRFFEGDAASIDDMRRCYGQISGPIGGIVHGAAAQSFRLMSHETYQATLARSVLSAWNLHTVSLERDDSVPFFIMLSSTAGVVGDEKQPHHAGSDVFHNALATYRCGLGLPSTSINLGPINDDALLPDSEKTFKTLSSGVWFGVNEAVFRRIIDHSLSREHHGAQRHFELASQAQIITGIAVPQPGSSDILHDVRLLGLKLAQSGNSSSAASGRDDSQNREMQTFLLCARSTNPDPAVLLSSAVGVLQAQFTKMLRLNELMDPAYPLNTYGMDSLAAAEPRSWVRTAFGVQLTTLDVVNAASLVVLCQKIISRMGLGKEV
ncbi:Atr6 [Stachybotrys chlorohalonatus IBT 40285]|uniref:Highly reducing polyketide synthase ATR6 n=1 Tax=Stachybotrys chlorohalonatus (strain IBT 40285) TaxID=1283841 RepID=ATR6_STAC4|nr:RecName: Full=Highly reducing polyketide synthase ATR6; AltName: Full=Core atranone cluster (CAC) protein 6 [Stachybotrys chlorohalonata IBT 40285]KFA70061.1 Atr6 [Stachybotrys chlorohalonata IBT 40285]